MSGTKVAMAQPHSFQSGALSFMSCTSGRESSPMDENDSHQPTEFKTEIKKKRFHPLRNLRRMFRRKTRRTSISADSYQPGVPENPEIPPTNLEQRSCSTSRLQEENLTQNLIRNSRLNPGLSLSHDSIFTPDRADSGLSSSDLENSSLSITVLTPLSKECPTKSQSSCSETSLLSIGSSEVELSPVRGGKMSDLDLGVTAYKLSHSAARHKMAVKPRRNHGAPRSRRRNMTSKSPLPTTLEVSEEGATGRSSPPTSSPPAENSQPSPSCDNRMWESKISWTQSSPETNLSEPEEKSNEVPKLEDEKEEEVANQKAESFFGRFLSRRSEKKKKLQESHSEDGDEDKSGSHFSKKFSKSSGKNVNRRQRVEPVEIPVGGKAEDNTGKKMPSSASPPKNYWPSQVTSRSISPPKAVWPDSFSYYVKPGEPKEVSPVKDVTDVKDLRNPSFVKELTDSVSMFAKDESGKRKKDEEDEAVLKARRQHSEEDSPQKKSTSDEVDLGKSNSTESIESLKIVYPFGVSIKTFPYDAISDGYENINIIESVKQEVKSLEEEKSVEVEKAEPEPVKKVEPEVVRRVKPVVSEKPKDLRKVLQDKVAVKPVEDKPKTTPTLVERRKSELFLLTEAEDKGKAKVKPLRKQSSFSETETQTTPPPPPPKEEEVPVEKTDPVPEDTIEEVVVLRKKSVASESDEQPELMKVFARRSLKIRESDKIVEDMQRSRDSDKENELIDSPKEDRKKNNIEGEEKKETDKEGDWTVARGKTEVKVTVSPLKPEVATRKSIVQRYGRSLSENNAKQKDEVECKRESSILEENKLNRIRNVTEVTISCHIEKGEKNDGQGGEEEETGFKRIQQRKAEWERRAQQGAK